MSWDETVEFCNERGIRTVPVLYRGIWNEEVVKNCYTGKTIIDGIMVGEQEGFVCRIADSFHCHDFANNVYKFVRPGFVAGDAVHWTKTSYKPNVLK